MNRDVTVREVMDREFLAASESDDLRKTGELMVAENTEPLLVLHGTNPVGVVTYRDVLATMLDGETATADATVGDAMVETVPTMAPDQTVAEARDKMATRSTPWVVVSDGAEPTGLITEHDVLASSALGTEVDAAAGSAPVGDDTPLQGHGGRLQDGQAAAERGAFEDQGICENCGSLQRGLQSQNGQLLCADCREM
jgi:CBS domain-containing protein